MTELLTTADLPGQKRFAFWQEAVCDTFVQLDCRSLSSRPFRGRIVTDAIDEVRLSRVTSRDQIVERTPRRIRAAGEEVMLVSLQLEGASGFTQDGREARLEPGDFLCYDSTRPYTIRLIDDFDMLVLHMPRPLMVGRLGRTEPLTARPVRGNSALGALAGPFLRRLPAVAATADAATALRLSEATLALVTAALGDLVSALPEGQSWGRTALAYRAKSFIDARLHDNALNTEAVAAALGISPRYLQDIFHAEATTVNAWIWARRLDKARRDLADPLLAGDSISQIALGAGFSDFAHFSRRFRAAYGMSPRDYRLARGATGA